MLAWSHTCTVCYWASASIWWDVTDAMYQLEAQGAKAQPYKSFYLDHKSDLSLPHIFSIAIVKYDQSSLFKHEIKI